MSALTIMGLTVFLVPTVSTVIDSLSGQSAIIAPQGFEGTPFFAYSIASNAYSLHGGVFAAVLSMGSIVKGVEVIFSLQVSLTSASVAYPQAVASPVSPMVISDTANSPSGSLP